MIEDYINCLDIFGFSGAEVDAMGSSHSILEERIRKIIQELRDAKKQAQCLARSEKEYKDAQQKLTLDMKSKNSQLEKANEHLNDTIKLVERIKDERNRAFLNAERLAQELGVLEDRLKFNELKKDEEINEIIKRSNEEIRSIREQYDSDRKRLQQEIDKSKQSNIDLQCEIGLLLREKRAIEFELNDVTKSIERQRVKMRADTRI
ncbi:hypothetical protein BKA69DRAFT_439585 [Paraphysoderma sedebokerense]|nr:hypothetical protein BKA69DRAFT_439585 [Paraphysoderma sedebokerense]